MPDQELSNLVIDKDGRLKIRNKNGITYKEVTGIRPTSNTEDDKFLGLISDKNFDEAFIFTFKY